MSLERYNRQILLAFIGEEGQRRICQSTVVVAGCGALGSTAANVLARAGVGCLRIVDRDFVEEVNLQRQTLFDEQDVRECLPKAVAAERRLSRINSTIRIEGRIADINPSNVEQLIAGATVVVDATDNFETRFLLNDACVKHSIPWVYGGAVGATGMSLTIVPGRTPCLRCVFEGAPPPGSAPTCEIMGILAGAAGIIGNWQATEALKLCAGRLDGVSRRLFSLDLWTGEARNFNVERARESAACPCCKQRRFEFLEASAAAGATVLCGRSAVQVRPPGSARVELRALAKALGATGGVEGILCNEYLLRFSAPAGGAGGRRLEVTVFADGRAIVKGTGELAAARAAYAKYVGM